MPVSVATQPSASVRRPIAHAVPKGRLTPLTQPSDITLLRPRLKAPWRDIHYWNPLNRKSIYRRYPSCIAVRALGWEALSLLDLMGGVALRLWGLRMVLTGVLRAFGPHLRLFLGIWKRRGTCRCGAP